MCTDCCWGLTSDRSRLCCVLVRRRSDDDIDPYGGSSGESYGHVAYDDALASEAAWMARR